jgi:O-antigen/teichoic acid export membrane protein
MLLSLKKKAVFILETLHFMVFGHEMGEMMKGFLGRLSWSFIGGIFAALVLFILHILAGRWLGPGEYGKYNLVFLMAQLFLVPMVLGLDVSVSRAVARFEDNAKEIQRSIASSFWVFTISLIASVGIFYIFKNSIAHLFSSTEDVMIVALIFSTALALKMFFDGVIKGLHLFRFQALVKVFEAVMIIIIFFVLYFVLNNERYTALVYAVALAGLFVVLMFISRLRGFFGKPCIKSIKSILQYAKFVVVGSIISLVLGYGDRFVVNRYFGQEELGIYSAYYTATILVISHLVVMTGNVFFPTLAKIGDKKGILQKVDRLFVVGFLPFAFGILLTGFVVLKLFGSAYELNLFTLLLFSCVASLQFFAFLYSNIVNAHNEKTYSLGIMFFATRSLLYVGYIVVLVNFSMLTVSALLSGLMVNYIIDIVNLRYILKRHALQEQ